MGHMTLTMPIRGAVVFIIRLAFDIFYWHTKFGDTCFSRSKDMIVSIKIKNESCDPNHAFLGMICHL